MAIRNSPQISKTTLKLVSLALALLLELYFYSQDNYVTKLITAVVEFKNVPSNKIIIDPQHADEGIPAHIEVTGPKIIVDQLAKGFHEISVPFPENAPYSFPVDIPYESLLPFPPSVNIIHAKPARVNIKTVDLVRKELPVIVELEGEPMEGYEITGKKVFPSSLILKGPLQELQNVNQITTVPVNVTDLNRSSRFELKVEAPGAFSALNVNLISVDVEIKPIETVEVIEEEGDK